MFRLFLVLLLTGCSPAPRRALEVQAWSCTEHTWELAGTAFAIPDGIVTARHLADLRIRFCDSGECVEAGSGYVGVGQNADWALFSNLVPPGNVTAFTNFGKPEIGLPVHGVGYPGGDLAVTSGEIVSVGDGFVHSAQALPGSSGGPVYEDNVLYGVNYGIKRLNGTILSTWVFAVDINTVVNLENPHGIRQIPHCF